MTDKPKGNTKLHVHTYCTCRCSTSYWILRCLHSRFITEATKTYKLGHHPLQQIKLCPALPCLVLYYVCLHCSGAQHKAQKIPWWRSAGDRQGCLNSQPTSVPWQWHSLGSLRQIELSLWLLLFPLPGPWISSGVPESKASSQMQYHGLTTGTFSSRQGSSSMVWLLTRSVTAC